MDASWRITPAGAGKTVVFDGDASYRQDHPRRCGENEWADLNNKVGIGSPPQVRGKRVDTQDSAQAIGITPAGAGKTCVPPYKECKKWDHPRRCGENLLRSASAKDTKGSPPQVRGKPYRLL